MTTTMQRAGAGRPERRKEPRVSMACDVEVGYLDDDEVVQARTRDISAGGMCIRGPLAAVPGDRIVVLLSLGAGTVPALATVVLTETIEEHEIDLHLEFSWLAAQRRQSLAQLLEAG